MSSKIYSKFSEKLTWDNPLFSFPFFWKFLQDLFRKLLRRFFRKFILRFSQITSCNPPESILRILPKKKPSMFYSQVLLGSPYETFREVHLKFLDKYILNLLQRFFRKVLQKILSELLLRLIRNFVLAEFSHIFFSFFFNWEFLKRCFGKFIHKFLQNVSHNCHCSFL